jgi:hypothetical protein
MRIRSKLEHNKNNLSDSERDGVYSLEIKRILSSQKLFNNFKRNHIYNFVLEHVDKIQGEEYLKVLRNRNDGFLKLSINSVLKSDGIGNPRKYNYIEGFFSPTTLRYVKVSSDLKLLFGSEIFSVAEIGCGYGGQTITSMILNKYHDYTLFDIHDVNLLIKKYLNHFIMDGSFIATTLNEYRGNNSFDLVISNYAFSELPYQLQIKYIEKVLVHSKRGYLTMNSGLYEDTLGNKIGLNKLMEYLPNVELYTETPNTGVNNYIVVWGNTRELDNRIFFN